MLQYKLFSHILNDNAKQKQTKEKKISYPLCILLLDCKSDLGWFRQFDVTTMLYTKQYFRFQATKTIKVMQDLFFYYLGTQNKLSYSRVFCIICLGHSESDYSAPVIIVLRDML